MALSEPDKDRVAELVHRARDGYQSGAPEYWRGGHPEQKIAEVFADLNGEEIRYAMSLLEMDIARLGERPDPVVDRVAVADARGDRVVQRREAN